MRLSDIDLRLLRVFKAVAEAGGFVKAQGVLGISQPAISSHISNLEQRLNVRLCNRGRQGFSLTTEGQEVLDQTNLLLDQLDTYANRLNEIGTRSVHRLRLGVVDCLITDPNNPLPTTIRAARNELPDLRVSVGVYDYLDCLTELRSARLDIALVGIRTGEMLPDDLEALHVYDEISGLFCAPDHPCCGVDNPEELATLMSSAEISAHSFLSNPIDDTLDMHLLDENADISQSSIESTLYLTLAGTHLGLIPRHYADHWVEGGALVAVAPERYRVVSQFHAVRLRHASPSEASSAVWSSLGFIA